MTDNTKKPHIAVIVAVDNQRGFAAGGKIPWRYAEDFNWFKSVTKGHICVMGRHTYEEIKAMKKTESASVLPDRDCYVVSNTLTELPDATVVKHISDVENKCIVNDINKTIFVIGGQRLFIEGVSKADTVYLTVINKDYNCDMFFPVEYVLKHFTHSKMFKSQHEDLRFLIYTRSSS